MVNPDKKPDSSGVPPAAAWLGGFGIIPFVVLSLAQTFAGEALKERLSFALLAYGAVILSFLGGIHWGLAIAVPQIDNTLWRRMTLSTVPALVGWVALVTPAGIGFFILAGAFVAMLLADIQASRMQEAPVWYPRLRWPLSCGAVATLLVGSFS
jgi:hypothetical protein